MSSLQELGGDRELDHVGSFAWRCGRAGAGAGVRARSEYAVLEHGGVELDARAKSGCPSDRSTGVGSASVLLKILLHGG